jgi:hypothetical protein
VGRESVEVTAPVATVITDTEDLRKCETYALVPSGLNAIEVGYEFAGKEIVDVTVPDATEITDTLLET